MILELLGSWDPSLNLPHPFYSQKLGEACCPTHLGELVASWHSFLSAPPKLISSPPFSFTSNWSRKHYGRASALIFLSILLLFTNLKWNMLAQGAGPLPLSPPMPFYSKMGEVVATQLAQASSTGELVASWWSILSAHPKLISSTPSRMFRWVQC